MKYLVLLLFSWVQAADRVAIDPAQQKALQIETAAVQPAQSAWSHAYPAKLRVPNAQLMVISAPQEGLLTQLAVAEGEQVQRNQVLALIQSPKLVEEQRLYLEALSRLELARAGLERDRQLKAEGIIAERRFLETRAQYMQARTEVEQRRQALALAGMDQLAIRQLEKKHRLSPLLQVRSPLDGVVLEQLATPGQRLEIADPIYRIGQLDPLWLEIQVPLEQLKGIRPGTAVRIPQGEGRIITIGSMIQGENQSVLVRAEIANPQGELRPGQFAAAQLAQPQQGQLWRIPRQALLRVDDQTWVMVKQGDYFQPVPVQIRAEESDAFIVQADLKAGDQIAISGTAALKAAWLEGKG